MASVNKAIIVGNLGKDPELRYAASGDAICNITVATTETWKDKASGERKENTEWHRIAFFGKLAEIAGQYLRKGSQVYIEGKIQTRKWKDKDGQDRYTTEIRGEEMKMLGSKPEGADSRPAPQGSTQSAPQRQQPAQQGGGFSDFDNDIPFNRLETGAAWRVI